MSGWNTDGVCNYGGAEERSLSELSMGMILLLRCYAIVIVVEIL